MTSQTDGIEFLEADERERQTFSDYDAVVGLCTGDPVLPANRLRSVHRFESGDRTWFIKRFERTQPKNQWRNRISAPRARLDGEREARVTIALRRMGIGAPRPVLIGRRGAESIYVCAELEGRSLAELGRDEPLDRRLVDAAACFCGGLFRRGLALPDLSAEHLFVTRRTDTVPRFAVLDLHNATVGRRPSERALRRSLRRFRRSVRDLGLSNTAQLRFAVRMLLESGLPERARRRLLARFQPLDTAARYSRGRPERYADRNPKRHRNELALLARVWPGRPGERILDLPCGAGRLAPFVRGQDQRWLGADGATPMAELAAARHGPGCFTADAAAIPVADRSVDGVVCFRFLHHCRPEVRDAVLGELARVADRFVVMSTFHPVSTHNLQRRLREWRTGNAPRRFSIRNRDLDRRLADLGFRLHRRKAQGALLRDLWVHAYLRD